MNRTLTILLSLVAIVALGLFCTRYDWRPHGKGWETKARLMRLAVALDAYLLEHGEYPDELQAVMTDLPGNWISDGEVLDSWGRRIIYMKHTRRDGALFSTGKDAIPGTEDDLTVPMQNEAPDSK